MTRSTMARTLLICAVGGLVGVVGTSPRLVNPPEPTPTVTAWPEIPQPPPPDPTPPRLERKPAPSRRLTTGPARTPAGVCRASWYGEAFRGRRTASGRVYNPDELVAAHRSWPFGTRVEVRHGRRTVVVTIVDRGPFIAGRCLDLSRAAFARLAPLSAGVIGVEIRR